MERLKSDGSRSLTAISSPRRSLTRSVGDVGFRIPCLQRIQGISMIPHFSMRQHKAHGSNLPHCSLQLQHQQRARNRRRGQGGASHQIIDMHRLVGE